MGSWPIKMQLKPIKIDFLSIKMRFDWMVIHTKPMFLHSKGIFIDTQAINMALGPKLVGSSPIKMDFECGKIALWTA
jgi:hypothetical protein